MRTLVPRLRAIFPRQMVVLVRIPGCSSLEVFASCFSKSPLIVRSESLVIIVKTALTVCSRTRGATSVKPVTCSIKQQPVDAGGQEQYHLWEDLVIDKFLM